MTQLLKTAQESGNLSFAINPRGTEAYRGLAAKKVQARDAAAVDIVAEMAAQRPARVLAALTEGYLQMLIPPEPAWKPKRVHEKNDVGREWLKANRGLLATHLEWPERRMVAVGVALEAFTRSRWLEAWHDPTGVVNPSVSLDRLLPAIQRRLTSGEVFLAFGLVALTSCLVFFHADDTEAVVAFVGGKNAK